MASYPGLQEKQFLGWVEVEGSKIRTDLGIVVGLYNKRVSFRKIDCPSPRC
jgi:hypothetical protein